MRIIVLLVMIGAVAAAQGGGGKLFDPAVISGTAEAVDDQPGQFTYRITVVPKMDCVALQPTVTGLRDIAAVRADDFAAATVFPAGEAVTLTGQAELEPGAEWGLLAVHVQLTPAASERARTAVQTVVVGTIPEPAAATEASPKPGEPVPERQVPIEIQTD